MKIQIANVPPHPIPLPRGERAVVGGNHINVPSPLRGCVVIGEMVKNVMLNLFQHLIESNSYETLNQVQGDKKEFTTQSLMREGEGGGVHNRVPPTSILPRKGGGGFGGYPVFNPRGISVLFLVIAMMLMVSIGYVFSYLIPTKQKSVSLTVSSNQAYFLAQSGVEFAVRYAFDQRWGTPADLAGLNAVGVNQRNLGKGRFTITYTDTAPNLDTLISVGEVPNASQRRIVVSNFTRFLMKIDYFASASTPVDSATATNTTNPTVVTPPVNMVAGDLVLMIAQQRATGATLSISQAGGQSWTTEAAQSQTNCTIRLFWCRFNGTWSANPSVSFGGTVCNTVVMHVFRPSNTSSVWQVDVPQVSGNFTNASTTVTIPGITTITDGALVFATWATADDNTWGSLTAGWSTPGSAQYRNTSGSDQSQTHAYKVMTIAGASGNVSKTQATRGPDAGAYLIIAFKAVIQ